jgi:hypothetical protein
MKTSKKPWPLRSTHGIKDRINTNPDFQRPAVWSKSQKQLLVDTILRDYDIPKLYWRKISTKPDKYDVVDGQQRLRAIWEFFDGEFPLPKNAEPIDGDVVANLHYEHLPDELRMRFDVYALDVVILEESDEDEVREMFLRLQNGTSLKAQEKRNAYPGKMRAFVRQLVSNPFFQIVGFANSRFNHDLVAAQLICLELAGGPTNIKSSDLNKMYEDNVDFDTKSSEAKTVQRTLAVLSEAFPEKTPELERFNVISVYCMVSEMQRQYVFAQVRPLLHDWFLGFEADRRSQEEKPEDEIDAEWASYKEKISHSTDAADSVRWRMDFMLRHFLERNPAIERKDNQRDFTHIQKLAIFRRDKGICQLGIKCGGIKLTWDDWHCDHKTPWSKGGHTTVANGQVTCSACNLSKGDGSRYESRLEQTIQSTQEQAADDIEIAPLGNTFHVKTNSRVGQRIEHHHRNPATQFRVTVSGQAVEGENASDIFSLAIERIGLERVSNLGNRLSGIPLVSRKRATAYQSQKCIDGWYITTHASNKDKKRVLEEISTALQIPVDVEIDS